MTSPRTRLREQQWGSNAVFDETIRSSEDGCSPDVPYRRCCQVTSSCEVHHYEIHSQSYCTGTSRSSQLGGKGGEFYSSQEQILQAYCPHAFLTSKGQALVIPDSHCCDLPVCPWARPKYVNVASSLAPSSHSEFGRLSSLSDFAEFEEALLFGEDNVDETTSPREDERNSKRKKSEQLRVFTGGSFWSAAFNTMNTILGSGTLAMPFAVRSTGLIFSQFLFFCMLLVNFCGIHLLLNASSLAGDIHVYNNYESLAFRTLGLPGVALVTVAFLGGGFGLLMANLLFIAQCLCTTFFGVAPVTRIRECVVVVAFLIVFPLSCFQSITKLRFSSFFSVCTTTLVAFFVAMSFLRDVRSVSGRSVLRSLTWGLPKDADLLTGISITISSFSCQLSVLPIYQKLQRRSTGKMRRVLSIAQFFALGIYEIIGITGYAQFGDSTEANILVNLMQPHMRNSWEHYLSRVANLFVAITLIASSPLVVWPLRSCLIFLLQINRRDVGLLNPLSYRRWVLTTFSIIATTTGFAVALPQVKVALTIVGSLGGAFICFIFPAVFWLLLHDGPKFRLKYFPVYFFILVGASLGVTSLCKALNHILGND